MWDQLPSGSRVPVSVEAASTAFERRDWDSNLGMMKIIVKTMQKQFADGPFRLLSALSN